MVVGAAVGSGYYLGAYSKNYGNVTIDGPEYATVKDMEKVRDPLNMAALLCINRAY